MPIVNEPSSRIVAMDKSASPRHFVALRPDPATARRLEELALGLAARCRGRALAACDLHLTLAFIGEFPATESARLAALLDGLPASHPGFALDRLGHFGPALLWIGPAKAPDWLGPLARAVRERLQAGSVPFDKRPLEPHLTLVRNARDRAATERETGNLVPEQHTNVAHWQLTVGRSHPAPSAQQRYLWRPVRQPVIAASPAGHNLYDTETRRQQ
jgi:2'-5' RNA ligase